MQAFQKLLISTVTLFILSEIVLLNAGASVDVEEARQIAKEAYIYGYPMVDSYRVEYAYFEY